MMQERMIFIVLECMISRDDMTLCLSAIVDSIRSVSQPTVHQQRCMQLCTHGTLLLSMSSNVHRPVLPVYIFCVFHHSCCGSGIRRFRTNRPDRHTAVDRSVALPALLPVVLPGVVLRLLLLLLHSGTEDALGRRHRRRCKN